MHQQKLAMKRDREDKPSQLFTPSIKVIGLGGAGSNAVDRMMTVGIPGVDYIVANTDRQALAISDAPNRIQLGPRNTRGLGAGGIADIGREAALESQESIRKVLVGANLVFIAAGMGGGTGTGAAPVVARIARKVGALAVAVVTSPFMFEGTFRSRTAQAGLQTLQKQVHTLIEVKNDRLLEVAPRGLGLEVAFRVADDVLRQGIQGIVELVTQTGLINLDFANVASIIQRGGSALMAIGQGEGPNRITDAANAALHHPLLDHRSMGNATGVLIHVTGGTDLELAALNQAVSSIVQRAHPTAEILFGASEDPEMDGRAQVIMIATGIHEHVPEPIAVQSLFGVPAPIDSDTTESIVDDLASDNSLDVPAFLRRRELFGLRSNNQVGAWATN